MLMDDGCVSGGVKVTGAGEQETGGGKQAAESCYRGGEEAEWCPGETTQGRQQERQQLKLRLNSSKLIEFYCIICVF